MNCRLSLVILSFVVVLGAAASVPHLVDSDSVYTRRSSDASSPEGLWQMRGDGAVFTIVPRDGLAESFDLYIIESPDLSIAENTYFGTMRRTGNGLNYDATLYTDLKGSQNTLRNKRRNFIIEVSADGSLLSLHPYTRSKRVNIMRWLPYLFRISITDVDTRPKNIDGARRIAPAPTLQPVTL